MNKNKNSIFSVKSKLVFAPSKRLAFVMSIIAIMLALLSAVKVQANQLTHDSLLSQANQAWGDVNTAQTKDVVRNVQARNVIQTEQSTLLEHNVQIPRWGFGAYDRVQTVHFDERLMDVTASSSHTNRFPARFGAGYNHFHTVQGITQSTYSEGDFIGTLRIERLNTTVRVFEGETMRNMDFGGGRFTFTGLDHGNVGIIGHNRGSNGFFGFVRLLREGDVISFETATGIRQYIVAMSYIVHETDFSPLYDFGDNRLTLVTCVEYRQRYRRIAVALRI